MSDVLAAFAEAAAGSDRMFWLDGGGSQAWSGRRSLLGALGPDDVSLTFDAGTRRVLRHGAGPEDVVGDDIFTALEEHVDADGGDPSVSWVGYFGYGCRTDLPGRPAVGFPDAVWLRVRDPLVIEHRSPAETPPPHAPSPTSSDGPRSEGGWDAESYAAAYARVQEALHAGDSYEVNLTYREQVLSDQDPVRTYLRLRDLNAAPYSGFLRHRGVRLLSSSPERFATIDRHRWLEAKPIKGTTPRGATPAEDAELARRLAEDPKYRSENLMIVDLLRNDLSVVCRAGTVTVPELMRVESYRSVHQLVSTVRGQLRPEISTIGALRELFPAGSMTGAPKVRTMEIIDAVEETPRGVYSGAFGWINADGRADLSVVIRTLIATPDGRRWRYELGTGGGVTVRSEVAEEYAETRWKAERLLAALAP